VDAFFGEAEKLLAWQAQADKTVLPLGDATGAAATAVKAVRAKVEDFFTRCRIAAFDSRAVQALNRGEAEYLALASKELSLATEELARLPLAHVEAGRALPLATGLNPAWANAVMALETNAVAPLLGANKQSLTEAEWTALQAKLAAHEAWLAAKPQTAVEKLGVPRLRELVKGDARARIGELLKKDLALEPEYKQLTEVEKLVHFQRDLFRLLNNTVNFSELYSRKTSIFQAGTLFLDGRSCELCLPVADAAKHATLAALAATYLAYCDCTRPNGEKMTVVAAFTDGDSDNLMVGRNGVLYDRQGRDWDATITKIVASPISIRQAFWAPYKKLVRMVEEQIAKRASASEAESDAKLTAAASAAANADKTKKTDVQKIDVGTVAALGVAIGGIGAMVTGLLASFFGLGLWMPVGVLGALLLVSGPSMLLAYLKLRQRNLGPILDANGWAINGRVRINVPFGAALTHVAALPPGTKRTLEDPYAEKGRPLKTYAAVAALLLLSALWYLGKLDGLLPMSARSIAVLGENAPAFQAPIVVPAPPAVTKPVPAKANESGPLDVKATEPKPAAQVGAVN